MLCNVPWDAMVSTPVIVEVMNCAFFWVFGFLCGFGIFAIFDLVFTFVRCKRKERSEDDGNI